MSVEHVDRDSYDAQVVAPDEVYYFRADFRWINVCLDALQGVVNRDAALVNVAVSLGNIVDIGVGEAVFTHYISIHTKICGRIMGNDYIRGYIAGDAASTLYQGPFPDIGFFVDNAIRRQYDAVADLTVAGHYNPIAENAAVADNRIMADMSLCHDEVVVADACATLRLDAAVYDHILADSVVIADVAVGFFTFPAEVLRLRADNRTLEHAVVLSHACPLQNGGIGLDFAAVADLHIFVDVGEGVDGYVGADLRRRINVC